jgi:hypothetical protein
MPPPRQPNVLASGFGNVSIMNASRIFSCNGMSTFVQESLQEKSFCHTIIQSRLVCFHISDSGEIERRSRLMLSGVRFNGFENDDIARYVKSWLDYCLHIAA